MRVRYRAFLVALILFCVGPSAFSQERSPPDPTSGTPQPTKTQDQQPNNDSNRISGPGEPTPPVGADPVFESPSVAAQQITRQDPNESEHESSSKNWSKIFLDHLPDWFVALFTAVLSLFTYKLWRATAGLWEATQGLLKLAGEQAQDMKASIAVAEKTAKAADLSAKAAIGLQLPIVRTERPHLFIQDRGEKDSTGKTTRFIDAFIERIVYLNRGSTIAYPKEYGICWLLTPHPPVEREVLPAAPDYDWVTTVNSNVTFKEQFTADFFDTFHFLPDAETFKAIMNGSMTLRVCAYLKYLDFLDQPHEVRFCWRYDLDSRGKRDAGLNPDDGVPESYTKKT